MLDLFLQASLEEEKTASAQQRKVDLLRRLPNETLHKLASGEEKLAFGDEKWLDRFKGTPLFEQALAIEQEDLQAQMQRKEEQRANQEKYRAEDAQRDELCIKRKMLDLELAKLEEGKGVEGEAFEGEETPEEEIAEHAQMQAKGEVPAPTPEAPAPVSEAKEAMAQLRDNMRKQAVSAGWVARGMIGGGIQRTGKVPFGSAALAKKRMGGMADRLAKQAPQSQMGDMKRSMVSNFKSSANIPALKTAAMEMGLIEKDAATAMGALKGVYNVAKKGFTAKKDGGVGQAAKNVGRYMGGLAQKRPGLAAGMVAAPALAAGYAAG